MIRYQHRGKNPQSTVKSHQRRLSRWLHNPRINVQKLYSPLIRHALAAWGEAYITLIDMGGMLSDAALGAVSRTSNSSSVAGGATWL